MKKSYQERMVVQEWMLNALLELMREMPYEKITVTQIVQRAGVPRMTYYRNYKSKEDILRNYSEHLTEELARQFRIPAHPSARDYLKIQFDFFLQHRDYWLALIKSHKEHIILDTLNKNIDSMGFETEEALAIKYYAGGIYNMMLFWLRSGETGGLNALLEMTFRLINHSVLDKAIQGYISSFTKYQ